MDYRNADGSVAEMCGNGTRVFAAYLRREGLETADEFAIATRAGTKAVRFESPDLIAVNLGPWRLAQPAIADDEGFDALVHLEGHEPALGTQSRPRQPAHRRGSAGAVRPGLPRPAPSCRSSTRVPAHGTNVEFVRPMGAGHIRDAGARARGGGDAVVRHRRGRGGPGHPLLGGRRRRDTWTVDVPGGRLRVRALPGQDVELAGPAALVADGTTDLV